MANKILTASGWQDRVRLKLGIDSAYISDADLAQPDIITVAEENIIEMVPLYTSLTGTDKPYLDAATVCECAILACPVMGVRLPNRQQGPHGSHELSIDWDKVAEKLREEKERYLSRIITLTEVPHFQLTYDSVDAEAAES